MSLDWLRDTRPDKSGVSTFSLLLFCNQKRKACIHRRRHRRVLEWSLLWFCLPRTHIATSSLFSSTYSPPLPLSHSMSEKMISADEVAKHNSKESCHVIVHGRVYDVTEFLPDHPGEWEDWRRGRRNRC